MEGDTSYSVHRAPSTETNGDKEVTKKSRRGGRSKRDGEPILTYLHFLSGFL
jgi:hypothetical protein